MQARKAQWLSIEVNCCLLPHLDCAGNGTSMPISNSPFRNMQRDVIEKYGSKTDAGLHSGKGAQFSHALLSLA